MDKNGQCRIQDLHDKFIAQQSFIAEILSDMDAEISALEGKLSKARQVKQGMMSVLLTGRVRLVKV
jgi:type I restriction enzyme S subunit